VFQNGDPPPDSSYEYKQTRQKVQNVLRQLDSRVPGSYRGKPMATLAAPPKSPVDIVTLANAKVLDENNKEVKVGTLWQTHPALFIFLRHFGCVGCRAHAVQIWSERAKYEKSGAKIIFISNGAPQFIKAFKEDLNILEAPVFTDPTLTVFKSCGFKRGFLAALGPKSLIEGYSLMKKGHENKREEGSGDYWQMGGIVAVQTDGRVTFHHICQSLGDYPDELENEKNTHP